MPARFAVDGVGLVTLKSALWAGVEHLATWTKGGLCEAEEQRDPHEHHGNGEQLAAGAA
jgi:hypothetical protein